MIADSGVSQKLWAEAINTTYYTQNRSMINKHLTKHYMKYGMAKFLKYRTLEFLAVIVLFITMVKII